MCVTSMATSTTTGRLESWYRNVCRLRSVHADPCVQDRVRLLRRTTTVAQHSSVDITSSTTVAGRLTGAVTPGLWQRDALWSTWQPVRQTTVCDEPAARLVCCGRK